MAPKSVNWTDPEDVRAIERTIDIALAEDGLEYEYEAVLRWAHVYEQLRTNAAILNGLEAVQADWDDVDDVVDAIERLAEAYTGSF